MRKSKLCTVSAIVIASKTVGAETRRRSVDKRRISPLTWRILAVNILALAILGGSLLYLGHYEDRLIQSELDVLSVEARIFANALGEGAVIYDEDERNILSPELSRQMVRRLVEASDMRTRLFDADGALLADSRILTGSGGTIQIEEVEEIAPRGRVLDWLKQGVDGLLGLIPQSRAYPDYSEAQETPDGEADPVLGGALHGEENAGVWALPRHGLMLTVAVPVQHYKQVLGAVVLSRVGTKIEDAIRDVRLDVVKIFAAVLFITILMSLYLARAIAHPIRLLAEAVEGVRQEGVQGTGSVASWLAQRQIPDLTARGDEIGELSAALREMNSALALRMTAIENFAADVAHEIKNPLTSLRSAVETAERIQDPARLARLMAVIRDDVDRLDRLISDISSASRLDAELSRAQAEPVDLGRMLATLVDFYTQIEGGTTRARVVLAVEADANLMVRGLEGRLVQVVQNLVDNALSFAPATSAVTVAARREEKSVVITVEDEGPGIPENKLEAVFDRFYSERPAGEKFGTHSGLGLSIARQIVEAHRGSLRAENRKDEAGMVVGARFTIRVPVGGAA